MRRFLTLLSILTLVLFGLGNKGCNDTPDDDTPTEEPAPVDVGALVEAGCDFAIGGIDIIEMAATLDKEPQFNPCTIAEGSKAGVAIAKSNVPAIVAEAADPDGKLHLMGGPVDFSRCMDMEGKPDPWPPTEPNPQVEASIKTFVPAGVLMVKSVIEPKLPTEGKECIEGKIAMAMVDAISEVVTTTVIDAVNGAPATQIPEFDVDYSGCGMDFSGDGE